MSVRKEATKYVSNYCKGSGCVLVGWAVASDTRGLQFESSYVTYDYATTTAPIIIFLLEQLGSALFELLSNFVFFRKWIYCELNFMKLKLKVFNEKAESENKK